MLEKYIDVVNEVTEILDAADARGAKDDRASDDCIQLMTGLLHPEHHLYTRYSNLAIKRGEQKKCRLRVPKNIINGSTVVEKLHSC